VRLNKRMAELGLCSRREADDWIARGWVRVNGAVRRDGPACGGGRPHRDRPPGRAAAAQQVTILINKPVGYVSGQAEDGTSRPWCWCSRKTAGANATAACASRMQQLRGLAPAGRLDIDSIGLLVLTQDGRVARQLIGEDSEMEKEYLVRVSYGAGKPPTCRPPSRRRKAGALRHGLSLDGQPLKPAQVSMAEPRAAALCAQEGKKRQIRRMCEQVGLRVTGLKRVRIGQVNLGHLPVGQWRYLAPHERF
jgi:23S rRNA pseudouridine2604 synthase